MKIEAAYRLLASDPIFYRGLQETWNADRAKNQHLIFVTTDREYALEYAKDESHVYQFHVVVHTPFEFGFRTLTTQVKFSDVGDRVRNGIMERFKHGLIRDKAMQLIDELRGLKDKHSGFKEVWEWYMQEPELVRILKAAGFDAIKAQEGANNDIETYGLFDAHQLKGIK